MPNKAEQWCVVCTEFHVAAGPYETIGEAITMAERLTSDKECVFLPVPMYVPGSEVAAHPSPSGHTGQYL